MTREQIEQLPAGRGLDALIAEKVIGTSPAVIYEVEWVPASNGEVMVIDRDTLNPESTVPEYSTDIAAAWQLLAPIHAKGRQLSVNSLQYGPDEELSFYCEVDGQTLLPDVPTITASADTAPLAICRAALLTTLT